MAGERREFGRVQFGRGYSARIMAIDGSWHRDCQIGDVSDSGAKLKIRGSLEGLDLRDFFLVLSSTGNAYRRCESVWVNGEELGARFLKDWADNHKNDWQKAQAARQDGSAPTDPVPSH